MINYYRTTENRLEQLDKPVSGSWINVINPTEGEIETLLSIGIPKEFITDSLDIDERSRTEKDEEVIFILLGIPFYRGENEDIPYIDIPLGIIHVKDYIVTICAQKNVVVKNMFSIRDKQFSTEKHNRFILQLFLTNSKLYLDYLKKINNKIDRAEDELQQSVHNRELLNLLKLQKSLVYFSTALKSNEITFEKLGRQKFFTIYPDDADLLEDVIIENLQAIEMTQIASNLLVQMMDAFASIISNNQNIIFKIMTAWTIILSLPTIIASFYGMNVYLPFQDNPNSFYYLIIISLGVIVIISAIFRRMDWI